MIDHDARSQEIIALRRKDGGMTRDDVLDNVTLYYTAISSTRLYWDYAHHPTAVPLIAGVSRSRSP
jgi:hypothetical protein